MSCTARWCGRKWRVFACVNSNRLTSGSRCTRSTAHSWTWRVATVNVRRPPSSSPTAWPAPEDDLRAMVARTHRGCPHSHRRRTQAAARSRAGCVKRIERRRGTLHRGGHAADLRHACALARTVAQAGYSAVVDGAFLQRWQREMFRETAAELGVPFAILAVSVPEATLRERIVRRRQRGRRRLRGDDRRAGRAAARQRAARRRGTAIRGVVGKRRAPRSTYDPTSPIVEAQGPQPCHEARLIRSPRRTRQYDSANERGAIRGTPRPATGRPFSPRRP